MTSSSGYPFFKINGCGNSFVLTSREVLGKHEDAYIARVVCSLGLGIGSDGLMIIESSMNDISQLFERALPIVVTMVNPDGSPMGMCGNGIRCVVRYLCENGALPHIATKIVFSVFGREIICSTQNGGVTSSVNMGSFTLEPTRIPVKRSVPVLNEKLMSSIGEINFSAISMGNPHMVLFDVPYSPELGAELENHPLFPERTNIEFCSRIDKQHIKVEMWERGAGHTLACGTGACAVAVIAEKLGIGAFPISIEFEGGTLHIDVDKATSEVSLTGPTTIVCRGTIDASLLP